jgi:hypothetical protein
LICFVRFLESIEGINTKTLQCFVRDDYSFTTAIDRLLHLGLIQRSHLDLIQVRDGQREAIW